MGTSHLPKHDDFRSFLRTLVMEFLASGTKGVRLESLTNHLRKVISEENFPVRVVEKKNLVYLVRTDVADNKGSNREV